MDKETFEEEKHIVNNIVNEAFTEDISMAEKIIDEVRRWLKKADADLRVSKELLNLNEEP